MSKTDQEKKTSRVGDAAVKVRTGKIWTEWFAILDQAGARRMSHKEIAAYLHEPCGVPGWWAQMVAVGYEQEHGLRAKYQKPDGYGITRSRTLGAPIEAVFAAWEDPRARARWLKEAKIVVRKATPGKSMRITWADGKTSVEVGFYPKGAGKCQVSVQHSKLADAKAAEKMKTYWGERLERLGEIVEG